MPSKTEHRYVVLELAGAKTVFRLVSTRTEDRLTRVDDADTVEAVLGQLRRKGNTNKPRVIRVVDSAKPRRSSEPTVSVKNPFLALFQDGT